LSAGAQRVELYTCGACGAAVRFPRYNDARRLLTTRRGRCGEWANVFTLLCRALGFDGARYVYDVSDHVWTEVWSAARGRWLHCDPCENLLDAPHVYAVGWRKELSYIFAASPAELVDVLNRYVPADALAGARARRTLCGEGWLRARLGILDQHRRAKLGLAGAAAAPLLRARDARSAVDAAELAAPAARREGGGAEAAGRETGSLAWRAARGELGVAPSPAAADGGRVWTVAPTPTPAPPPAPPRAAAAPLREWRLRYSAQRDGYFEQGASAPTVAGWQYGAFACEHMQRAVELDWNMVYLARARDATAAAIEWRFAAAPGWRIVGGRALLTHSLHADGARVRWRLSRDRGASWRGLAAPTDVAVNLDRALAAVDARGARSDVESTDGCAELWLRAELSGGTWQSAQLFRQSRSEVDAYLFELALQLAPAAAAAASAEPAAAAAEAARPAAAASATDADAAHAEFAALFATLSADPAFAGDPSGAAAEAIRRARAGRGGA
jgi:peptide-N4-(N-acetyl-beta-glucosaminyl)asparagine amidase